MQNARQTTPVSGENFSFKMPSRPVTIAEAENFFLQLGAKYGFQKKEISSFFADLKKQNDAEVAAQYCQLETNTQPKSSIQIAYIVKETEVEKTDKTDKTIKIDKTLNCKFNLNGKEHELEISIVDSKSISSMRLPESDWDWNVGPSAEFSSPPNSVDDSAFSCSPKIKKLMWGSFFVSVEAASIYLAVKVLPLHLVSPIIQGILGAFAGAIIFGVVYSLVNIFLDSASNSTSHQVSL